MRSWRSVPQFALLTDLPLELTIILAACDFKTALALVLVSKQFSRWATPGLYKHVNLKDQAALERFKAVLDKHPSRSQYVKALSLTRSTAGVHEHSVIVSILTKTISLSHLVWNEATPDNSLVPIVCFPTSLRNLDIHWFAFDSANWNTVQSFPFSANLEALQLNALVDLRSSVIEHISLQPFTSLKYLLLRSNIYRWPHELNALLVSDLIPNFPDTLRVCLIYYRVGLELISSESIALIMGEIDDRVLIYTDERNHVSPRGSLHDCLIRWDDGYQDRPFVNPHSPLYSGSSELSAREKIPTWESLELLVKRRIAIREPWPNMAPTARLDQQVYRFIDYSERWTAHKVISCMILGGPALVLLCWEMLQRRVRRFRERMKT
ncbi:hypothetical protein DL96DRAFT_1580547 [Flagelloscypha sp. PMI_526]|nr:hypothetical protein DL96DRAFT_1580547 [Flagelloscypha sp. PMI_526]